MAHNYDEIDQVFLNDGYNLAREIIGSDLSEEKMAFLTRNLYQVVDQLLDSFTGRLERENQPLGCRKGCSWCCTQPVFTNEWEAAYLRQFMKKRFTGDKLVELKDKAEIKDREVSALPQEAVLKNRIPCPLLHENVCSVYPARPMACRIYLSSDVDSCIEEFRNPSNNTNYAKLYDFPLHAGRKMNEGIAGWMEEQGFEVKEMRLEQALNRKW